VEEQVVLLLMIKSKLLFRLLNMRKSMEPICDTGSLKIAPIGFLQRRILILKNLLLWANAGLLDFLNAILIFLNEPSILSQMNKMGT
jgi:hypothetical protein